MVQLHVGGGGCVCLYDGSRLQVSAVSVQMAPYSVCTLDLPGLVVQHIGPLTGVLPSLN